MSLLQKMLASIDIKLKKMVTNGTTRTNVNLQHTEFVHGQICVLGTPGHT